MTCMARPHGCRPGIRPPGQQAAGQPLALLCDLERDATESYNVLPTYPDKAAELAALLSQWEQATATNPRGFRKQASAAPHD